MKTVNKVLMAGIALAIGGVANAQIAPYPSTGSDIVLFVTDLTTNSAFYQDMGVSLNTLGVTTASVQADALAGNSYSLFGNFTNPGPLGSGSGPITVGAGLIVGGVDLALQAFTTGHTSDVYVYGFLAAANGDGSTGVGQARLAATFTGTNATGAFNDEPATATLANPSVPGNANFFSEVNAASTCGTYCTYVSQGTLTPFGSSGGDGAQASSNFSLTTHVNSAAAGATTYFVEFAGFGDGNDANVYQSLTPIVVNANGTVSGIVSGTSSVPLPAAVWLLGSGVIGLLGIGRRRREAAKA